MERKAILSLHLATIVGWATLDRAGAASSGTHGFELVRGESSGLRYLRFRRWIREMLGVLAFRPGRAIDLVAYERPHYGDGATTAFALGLVAVVEEECARLRIDLAPVHSGRLRSHATGRRSATEEDLTAAIASRWGRGRDALNSTEADALAVLGWAMDEIGVAPARREDGPRGGAA